MKTKVSTFLWCPSWVHGKHSDNIEINTKLPYVAIYDFYCQGDDADAIISEILYIYNIEDCTPLQAAEKWASNMF